MEQNPGSGTVSFDAGPKGISGRSLECKIEPTDWQAWALGFLAASSPGGNLSIYCLHVLTL